MSPRTFAPTCVLRASTASRSCSVGIAGANVHLDRCLRQLDDLRVEEGWDPEIAVIRSELSASRCEPHR